MRDRLRPVAPGMALAACVLLAAGCRDTANIGGLPSAIFFSISGVSTGGTLTIGQTITITAMVHGASGPYDVEWNFGGGATPNAVTVTDQNGDSTSTTVTVTAQGTFTGQVTATEKLNPAMIAGPFVFTYTVNPGLSMPPWEPDPPHRDNQGPRIDTMAFDAAAGTISVLASDDDPEDTALRIRVTTEEQGVWLEPASQTIANPGTAVFTVQYEAPVSGSRKVGFRAFDEFDASPEAIFTMPIPAADTYDTLTATPLEAEVVPGQPVTVLVTTGVTAHPFQYMIGCGLTVEADATYVANSLNVGDVGGVKDFPDGIWADMNGGTGPSKGFLLAPDFFNQSTPLADGRERWDFNLTPLNGSNLTASEGAVFNCQFTFSEPGIKRFGFERQSGVKRTYYADNLTEYFWGEIKNSGLIARNRVEVK